MTRNRYASLDEVRAEKLKMKQQVERDAVRLRNGLTDSFMPTNSLMSAPSGYLRGVGYIIATYKTFMNFKGLFKFLSKWL
ncbi:MAG: hypothetical protein IJP82_09450 [Bacteroidaceae bacterium]|nr:hypothetical protein [Bacteroidaceae bacterium]